MFVKFLKYDLTSSRRRDFSKGIDLAKTNLIAKLKCHIPPNGLSFWENLPVCNSSELTENE